MATEPHEEEFSLAPQAAPEPDPEPDPDPNTGRKYYSEAKKRWACPDCIEDFAALSGLHRHFSHALHGTKKVQEAPIPEPEAEEAEEPEATSVLPPPDFSKARSLKGEKPPKRRVSKGEKQENQATALFFRQTMEDLVDGTSTGEVLTRDKLWNLWQNNAAMLLDRYGNPVDERMMFIGLTAYLAGPKIFHVVKDGVKKMRGMKTAEEGEADAFICQACGVTFSNAVTALQHVETEHPEAAE